MLHVKNGTVQMITSKFPYVSIILCSIFFSVDTVTLRGAVSNDVPHMDRARPIHGSTRGPQKYPKFANGNHAPLSPNICETSANQYQITTKTQSNNNSKAQNLVLDQIIFMLFQTVAFLF